MTDDTKAGTEETAIDERVARIFERAVAETFSRLEKISDEERADNMAFDRAARTALAFLRVAEAASQILSRKRKEDAANDEGVEANLPSREDVERLERTLNQRVARSLRGQKGRRDAAPAADHEGGRD